MSSVSKLSAANKQQVSRQRRDADPECRVKYFQVAGLCRGVSVNKDTSTDKVQEH